MFSLCVCKVSARLFLQLSNAAQSAKDYSSKNIFATCRVLNAIISIKRVKKFYLAKSSKGRNCLLPGKKTKISDLIHRKKITVVNVADCLQFCFNYFMRTLPITLIHTLMVSGCGLLLRSNQVMQQEHDSKYTELHCTVLASYCTFCTVSFSGYFFCPLRKRRTPAVQTFFKHHE
jgi:hypothetical protein